MIEIIENSELLPDEWNSVCGDNYAMKREFLKVMQQGNELKQFYAIFRNTSGNIDSILSLFHTPKCNIFLYTPVTINMSITFIHLPLSITKPGFIIGDETREEVFSYIKSIKGNVVLLNWKNEKVDDFALAPISSQIAMNITWKTFDEYLSSLRSHYRYRCKKALKKSKHLTVEIVEDNMLFDETLYSMYEAVHGKSKIGLEKLNINYFQKTDAKILLLKEKDTPIGFVQIIDNFPELVFAFVGIDYNYNTKFDTYQSLLLLMVKYAIENNYTIMEMGQTAEDAKLKLGGEFSPLYALIRHSNPIMNIFTKLIFPHLGYRQPKSEFRIFKEEEHTPSPSREGNRK